MGKKKTKTSSQMTAQATTTPINPVWSSDLIQGLSGQTRALGQIDPQSLVAPASAQEVLGANRALALDGQAGLYEEAAARTRAAADMPAPQVQAASLLENLEAYANPYGRQVTDAAMADFDAEAGRVRAQQNLSLAGAGAFGGSGAALTRAQTEGELARARNTQLSGLLSDMFRTSATLSGQDADRRQQASMANAQFAADQAARRLQGAQALAAQAGARAQGQRDDIATQAAIGAQMRGIDQARRMAPFTALNAQADIAARLPLELFRGQSVSESRQESGTVTERPGLTDYIDLAIRAAALRP